MCLIKKSHMFIFWRTLYQEVLHLSPFQKVNRLHPRDEELLAFSQCLLQQHEKIKLSQFNTMIGQSYFSSSLTFYPCGVSDMLVHLHYAINFFRPFPSSFISVVIFPSFLLDPFLCRNNFSLICLFSFT